MFHPEIIKLPEFTEPIKYFYPDCPAVATGAVYHTHNLKRR
jgi:hypothetical protein